MPGISRALDLYDLAASGTRPGRVQTTRAPTWILSVLRDSLATSCVCAIRASKHFGEGFESGDRAAKPAPIGSCRCSCCCQCLPCEVS